MNLTPRQQQLANLVAEGRTDAQIGETLHITAETVKTQLKRIRAKYGVPNRTALAVLIRGNSNSEYERGRREAAEQILAEAAKKQTAHDETNDPDWMAILNEEIDNLWEAARIAHEPTWRERHEAERATRVGHGE